MLNKIKKIIINHWRWLLLTLVAVIFFAGTSSYNYFTQRENFIKWSSPDEAANYNFSKLYAQTGRLSFFEKYNLAASDIIRPRSYLSEDGTLKPASFLGLILIYGKIAGLISYKIIPYLTPFFAAAGLIFYFLLIKEIFGKKNGLISALFLASFPPYIYYSAHSLFHNELFTVLLIISLYWAVTAVKNGPRAGNNFWPNAKMALAGIFLGLAVMVRASELIWLIPLWMILWLYHIRRLGLIKLLIFLSFLTFSLLPAAGWNKILYGSFWRGGYNEMNQSILNIASAGVGLARFSVVKVQAIKANLAEIKNNIFYFGFQPVKSLDMFYYYFIAMFYWLFWPAIFGLVLFFRKIKKWQRRHYAYLSAYAAASLILLFYYGSWEFHDNPDPLSRTIGNSYTRYWLPIYLGAMPLASFFLIKLTNILRGKILVVSSRLLVILLIFFVSLKFVLTGSAEGLIQSARKQPATFKEFNQVLKLTEGRSVIITRYHDKLLFPERKVIVGLFNDENMIRQYAVLAGFLPVYYYNFTLSDRDIAYLNSRRLVKFNLEIKLVAEITKDFTLYKLLKL